MGTADVQGLAKTLNIRDFRRWFAYYRLEPFGNDWRRTAKLATITAAALGAKVQEDFEEMFLPTFDPSRPRQTPEQMMAELAKIRIPGKQE